MIKLGVHKSVWRIEMSKKIILQGIDNFKKLIDNNGYYVDKTLFIKELIDIPNEIILITRPRRFGKTLNMSMLKYFFEAPKCRMHDLEEVDTAYLFEDLAIFNNEEDYRNDQGKYPLVYLTFKNAKQNNWEDTLYNLKQLISNEYKRHRYLLEDDILSNSEKEVYQKIMDMKADDVQYTDVINGLTEYLKRYFGNNCMVIIDEYDTPIQAGYIHGYFEKIIEFSKSALVKGFKDNKALKQGVLTGIMKVAQESIFSDFNNPLVCTILSEEFKKNFGFTEAEVEKMAKYFSHADKLEDVKKWYNGYIFGEDTVIYNPWSIIKYMYNPKNGLKPYWINTSDNQIIKDVMQLDKVEGKIIVEKLIKGEEVRKVLEENVVYQSIKDNPNVAWSFLLHAGYLKAYNKKSVRNRFEYKLGIPNWEVKTIYEEMIINYFKEDAKIAKNIEVLLDTLLKKDIKKFERLLQELYLKQVSYHDVKLGKQNIESMDEFEQDERYENFHHGFMLGIFMLIGPEYSVESNREYGFGRPDLVIIPKDTEKTAYIFEFKWDSTKGTKTLDMLLEKGKNQIVEQKYKEGLKAVHGHENVLCISVGFKGKDVKIIDA